MDKLTADTVADFFIRFSHVHGDYITNLKLQKLVYYAQAWHLALHNEPLIDNDFQAWIHGPVCPSLYGRFKKYRWNPITEQPEDISSISKKTEAFLIEIYEVYGQYTGYQLEQMTHSEDPWINARRGIQIDEASSEIISQESMLNFYSKLALEEDE